MPTPVECLQAMDAGLLNGDGAAYSAAWDNLREAVAGKPCNPAEAIAALEASSAPREIKDALLGIMHFAPEHYHDCLGPVNLRKKHSDGKAFAFREKIQAAIARLES